MTLHAVVVRQPWASLVAHGIKQIETRGFAPKSTVRPGDRLAIVAGANPKSLVIRSGDPHAEVQEQGWRALKAHVAPDLAYVPVPPLGAVVAVVTYDEALRIADVPGDADDGIFHDVTDGEAWVWTGSEDRDITDQLPLGDFTPGRYGWMLSNPQRLPIPVRCRAVGPDGTRTHMQGVFRLPAAVEAAVVAQVGGES